MAMEEAEMEGMGAEEEGMGMEEAEASADEGELVVDPSDPMYGLEQRLKHCNLDEATKAVIKSKLMEAHNKIKQNLEGR